jgi:hypothetical protein
VTLSHLCRALCDALGEHVEPGAICPGGDPHDYIGGAVELVAGRLADGGPFRAPARTLFEDVRWCFPLNRQARVRVLVDVWVRAVEREVAALKDSGLDADGNPLRCPVFTRQGRQCQRPPRPHNGYCPSHQHLAPVEHDEVGALAAAV